VTPANSLFASSSPHVDDALSPRLSISHARIPWLSTTVGVGCTDCNCNFWFSAFLFQKKQCDRGRPLAPLTFAYGAARCASKGVAFADWTTPRQVWQLAGLVIPRRRLSPCPPTGRRQVTSGQPWRKMIDGGECSACCCVPGPLPTFGWGRHTWSAQVSRPSPWPLACTL